jgi:hypothetical protein
MLMDRHVRFVERQIDSSWYFDKLIPTQVRGFNPFRSEIFFGRHSPLATWLKNPKRSIRPFNEDDRAIREVLFSVHDYLHLWAYLVINEAVPRLGVGTRPITRRTIEDFAFCHLLTEAVAVVGLDYWYLSTIRLDEELDAGTTINGLAVTYHERFMAEYRRFNPGLTVQKPDFLGFLTRFYCSGEFEGFDERDIANSSRLDAWLSHEVLYGEKQREYIRMWLAYLSEDDIQYTGEQLQAPLRIDAKWKRDLIEELQTMLWKKVKDGDMCSPAKGFDRKTLWTVPKRKIPDFRFTNLNAVDPDRIPLIANAPHFEENFRYLFYQFVSKFDRNRFDATLIPLFKPLAELRNFKILDRVFRDEPMIQPSKREPLDMLILN